jgi:sulfur carrier protein
MNNQITVTVNGKTITCSKHSVVADVLTQYTLDTNFALAVNNQFVGKENYHLHQLNRGDKIDIFTPIVGG